MRFFVAAILAFILCHVDVAWAEDKPLTIEETLRRVYIENPRILEERYALGAVMEDYTQAAAGWKPTVGAETSITSTKVESGNFSTGDGATTKSASINIEQPIFRGFRTTAEMAAARYRIAAAESRVRGAEQDVFLSAIEAYMNVIRDRLLLSLQRKKREVLGKERDSVLARFEAGDVTQTDVKQTEAEYSKAVAEDTIAESALLNSEAEFEEVTGLMAPEEMTMPRIQFAFPKTMDGLVKTAAAHNPNLIITRSEHEAAEEDISAAESDFYPQITAFASHIKEYDPQPGIVDESETSAIGLRARISLYEGGSTISRIRAAKQRANQAFVQILRQEKSVKSDLISDWKRMQAFEAEIAARELEVAASKYANEGVREEAKLGERTVLDTLEAEQDVIDSETNLIQAKRDRIVVAYRLAASLGMLRPEYLGITEVAFHPNAE